MTVDYSLKTKRDEFRKGGIFYTPQELGLYLKSFLPTDIDEIYDPTCGHGALLELFPDTVKKYGQEINSEAIEPARSLPNSEIVHGDTLVNPAFLDHKFRAIIANPPFSVKWTPVKGDPRFDVAPVLPPASKADFAFVLHILHYLSEDGVAAVIVSGGLLYREQAEGKIRRWMVDQNYIDQIISIPPETFRDTSVPVTVIILKKNRQTTNITFTDKKTRQSVEVPREQIVTGDYRLSPAMYLPRPEEEKTKGGGMEEILANDLELRKQSVESLRQSIEIARVLHTVVPGAPPVEPLLDDLQAVLDEARPRTRKLESTVIEHRSNTVECLHKAMEIERELQRHNLSPFPIDPWLDELQAIVDQMRPAPHIRVRSYSRRQADKQLASSNLSLF